MHLATRVYSMTSQVRHMAVTNGKLQSLDSGLGHGLDHGLDL